MKGRPGIRPAPGRTRLTNGQPRPEVGHSFVHAVALPVAKVNVLLKAVPLIVPFNVTV